MEWLGQPVTIRTNGLAGRADGAVMVNMGGTIVLATTIIDQNKTEYLDFVPLSVHYFEKTYAVNKIPNGFTKREGRPQDHEVRIARLMDRAIRPLMPDGLGNEVQIIVTVLGFNYQVDTIIPSLLAASLSLKLSGLPLKTDENMCGISVGDIFAAVTSTKIVMLEGEGKEIPHMDIYKTAQQAMDECRPMLDLMTKITAKVKPCKVNLLQQDPLCHEEISAYHKDFMKIIGTKKKIDRVEKTRLLKEKVFDKLKDKFSKNILKTTFDHYLADCMIGQLVETNKRIDGRGVDEIRPISIELGILSKAHGSALFTRGDTQVLAVLTVAGGDKKQYIDDFKGHAENLIFHYNFPPFCVGDVDRVGAPGRREIGHGYIGFRAIKGVLPHNPNYTYRIVSEVLSCNGSSSMASVCGASLALQMAGVTLNNPVAGIGLGYVRSGKKDIILTDILGDEDHMGLMDMKLAGSVKGITAIQMDVKVPGISLGILSKALTKGRKALTEVLSVMNIHIDKTPEVNQIIPKIDTIEISKEAVSIIGKGAFNIKHLLEPYAVKVDVKDFGLVTITGTQWDNVYAVKKIIRNMTDPIKKGTLFECEVSHIVEDRVTVRFNRYLKGYVKFKNKTLQQQFTQNNPMGAKISLSYVGLDKAGDITLKTESA